MPRRVTKPKRTTAKPKRGSRKLPHTPPSVIKSALGALWLRSRERAAAIQREGNTCEICKRKGSKAKGRERKIEVHHIESAEWDKIIAYIRRRLLVDPSQLAVVCSDCHKDIHLTGEM